MTHNMMDSSSCGKSNVIISSKRRKNRSMFSFRSIIRCEPTFSSRVPLKKTVPRHRSTHSLGWLSKSAKIQKKQRHNVKSLNTENRGRKKKRLNLVRAAELRSLNVKLRERAIELAKMAIYYKKMYEGALQQRDCVVEQRDAAISRTRLLEMKRTETLRKLQNTEEKLIDLEGLAKLNKSNYGGPKIVQELEMRLASVNCDLALSRQEKDDLVEEYENEIEELRKKVKQLEKKQPECKQSLCAPQELKAATKICADVSDDLKTCAV
eukprot:CAMPEP_0185254346 /NCGR_PEP_ID=MMETSP1359-20130426/3104_1 /TAXON_ID=552665 /ORGANISM="Bigelowiella longifila, Strain CCMP242" /LENGTH=265 /DNA_ID=CAMNT_0027837269 /DNA_START=72 /DNA_END=870 /DNA_ORIENTATION=+